MVLSKEVYCIIQKTPCRLFPRTTFAQLNSAKSKICGCDVVDEDVMEFRGKALFANTGILFGEGPLFDIEKSIPSVVYDRGSVYISIGYIPTRVFRPDGTCEIITTDDKYSFETEHPMGGLLIYDGEHLLDIGEKKQSIIKRVPMGSVYLVTENFIVYSEKYYVPYTEPGTNIPIGRGADGLIIRDQRSGEELFFHESGNYIKSGADPSFSVDPSLGDDLLDGENLTSCGKIFEFNRRIYLIFESELLLEIDPAHPHDVRRFHGSFKTRRVFGDRLMLIGDFMFVDTPNVATRIVVCPTRVFRHPMFSRICYVGRDGVILCKLDGKIIEL